jgi:hypothetical protein
MILHDTSEMAGCLDIPIAVVASERYATYLCRLLQYGARLVRAAPGVNLEEIVPAWSQATYSEVMIQCARNAFESRLRIVARDIRFVNVICDAGTVLTMKVVHCAFTNPSRLPEILPLDPYENTNWTANHYASFFHDIVTNFGEQLEICGIICDNLPAQVAGLRQFLAMDNGRWAGVIHVPCLNHMINLVFSRILSITLIADVMATLPGITQALRSPAAQEIIGKRCPSIVRTRWVYLVDILGFICRHFESIQTFLVLADTAQIPVTYAQAHILLLPLALFSRVMETRSRLLADVIPAAREVLREWREIKELFGDSDLIVDCLQHLTAHFLARFRSNAYDTMLTAFALTPFGRGEIRLKEQGYQTHGPVEELSEPPFVQEMHAEFQTCLADHQMGLLLREEESSQPRLDEVVAGYPLAADNDRVDIERMEDSIPPEDPSPEHFRELLDQEQGTSLDMRLNRDFIDGILTRIENPIRHQSAALNYQPDDIIAMFRDWWTGDEKIPATSNPDAYWREFHGRAGELKNLAHIALRFITLGCSEADMERTISLQKHIQGVHGTNYRLEIIGARAILHTRR